jgi:hypothetical protein
MLLFTSLSSDERNCVFVKSVHGDVFSIPRNPKLKFSDIKQEIYMQKGIPPKKQSLIFRGGSIPDDSLCDDLKCRGQIVMICCVFLLFVF